MKNDQIYIQIIGRLSDAICNINTGYTQTASAQIEEAKKELATVNLRTKRKKLKTDEKIYRQLSDMTEILRKIECHGNEERKLIRLQTELIYHIIKLGNNGKTYNDEGVKEWWQRLCRITD